MKHVAVRQPNQQANNNNKMLFLGWARHSQEVQEIRSFGWNFYGLQEVNRFQSASVGDRDFGRCQGTVSGVRGHQQASGSVAAMVAAIMATMA